MKTLAAASLALATAASPVAAQDHAEWWRLNAPRFLQLKQAARTGEVPDDVEFFWRLPRRDTLDLGPTEEQRRHAVGKLTDALASARDEDLVGSCLTALAKIGLDPDGTTLVGLLAEHLSSESREVRRSALLALGIAGDRHPEAIDRLRPIAADPRAGSRAFAVHAVGIALRGRDSPARQRALATLRPILADGSSSIDVRVAAAHAIGELEGHADALACLAAEFDAARDPLLRAHCATAIGKLARNDEPGSEPLDESLRERFSGALARDGGSVHPGVRQSCALALGRLCRPVDADQAFCRRLLEAARDDPDRGTRHFALLALGQIGGPPQRAALLELFAESGPAARAWCALALGVLSFRDYERQKYTVGSIDPDTEIGATLLAAFEDERAPALLGALAIGLGLNQHAAAAAPMRALLRDAVADERLASQLCTGLALMHDRRAIEVLMDVMARSQRRPDLFVAAAVALGKIGDKNAADDILRLGAQDPDSLARHAVRMLALGQIGDQRVLVPLCGVLADADLPPLRRAFAAVAVGGICADGWLPWNASLAANLNFHALTPTLRNRESGVLDRL